MVMHTVSLPKQNQKKSLNPLLVVVHADLSKAIFKKTECVFEMLFGLQ